MKVQFDYFMFLRLQLRPDDYHVFLYADDDMANWDEAKLEEVVQQKHGEFEKAKPKTAIVRTEQRFFNDLRDRISYMHVWPIDMT